jgi:microcystin-dependent protein
MAEPYVGEIRPFAGNFAPVGWMLCDGSLLDIANNQVLFTLIGTTYGGNGQTTFALPDLRGRALIHQGTGAGLSTYVIGQPIGVENVTVGIAQMAGHSHTFNGTGSEATTSTPSTSVVLASAPAGFPIYDGNATAVALSSKAVTSTGGSLPHNNRQPFLAITYIISLFGLFPSHS